MTDVAKFLARHDHVGNDEVETVRIVFEDFHGLFAIAGLFDFIAARSQKRCGNAAHAILQLAQGTQSRRDNILMG